MANGERFQCCGFILEKRRKEKQRLVDKTVRTQKRQTLFGVKTECQSAFLETCVYISMSCAETNKSRRFALTLLTVDKQASSFPRKRKTQI